MGIIIDILAVLIIAICTIIGYKRGLVKVAIGFIAFIIALIVSIILFKPISNFITYNTSIGSNLKNTIYNKIEDEDLEMSDNAIIKFADKYIIEDIKDTTAEMIAESLTETIIEVLTFILLTLLIRIVLVIINKIFVLITELPLVKQFNKIGGFAYGIAQGILINYIIFAILVVTLPFAEGTGKKVEGYIEKSIIGSILYEENIIVKFLS